MNEIWKSIEGYEGLYEVSNLGKVKSVERYVPRGNHQIYVKERILKPELDKDGYLLVNLSKNGVQRMQKIHRLVAIAFIPNVNNLPIINHLNEIKFDNRVENLEWCDNLHNVRYGTGIERNKQIQTFAHGKKVLKKDLLGNVLESYPSTREAARENNTTATQIRRVCQGKQRTCIGYTWEYEN